MEKPKITMELDFDTTEALKKIEDISKRIKDLNNSDLDYENYKRLLIKERIKAFSGKPLSKILDVEYDLEQNVYFNCDQGVTLSEIQRKLFEEKGE